MLIVLRACGDISPAFLSAFYLIEPISFLNHRLSSSSGVDSFEATLARDVSTPSCAGRLMILLTSSSIPFSALSNAGMGKNGRDASWSLADFFVSVPLGNKTDQKLSSPFLI